MVNSEDNLAKTEDRFRKIQETDYKTHWKGIVKKKPEVALYEMSLFKKDIYLYMGHGTGFEHLSDTCILNFRAKCLMMVFGCGSCKMSF